MKKNEWLARFGAKRRATDKAILQECERQIAKEEKTRDTAPAHFVTEEMRRNIARAMGRPLAEET